MLIAERWAVGLKRAVYIRDGGVVRSRIKSRNSCSIAKLVASFSRSIPRLKRAERPKWCCSGLLKPPSVMLCRMTPREIYSQDQYGDSPLRV
jgi:hypothetical protein